MIKFLQGFSPFVILLIATILEVAGDAIVRKSIYNYTGAVRAGSMLLGALLLLGYGFVLNLAPVEFGKIVGLYIATLFVVWQIGNYIAFGAVPATPVFLGGALIVLGGLIVTFWRAQ